jgi:hypothetical protein
MKAGGVCESLTEVAEPQSRIETTAEDLQRFYSETLKAMADYKGKMTRMELAICRGETTAARAARVELNLAIENLDRLTDSLISRSKSAWEDYRRFERDCKSFGFGSSALDNLRVICEKTERLASDLFCYSMGRASLKGG